MKTTKQKRIKRVFGNHNQVLHLWANQSQEDARCKNVFFKGTSAYSYGYHYELGRLVTIKGKTVALINARGYSVTTSKHISSAWSAVAHLPRIKCYDGFDFKNGLLATQAKLLNEMFSVFARTSYRYTDWTLDTADYCLMGQVNDFNKTCLAVGLPKLALDVSDEYYALVKEHALLNKAKYEASKTPEGLVLLAVRSAKREALNIRKALEQIEAWRRGSARTNAVAQLRPMILRVIGDKINTSGGASVSIVHALKLYRRIKAGVAKSGEHVGSFTFNSISKDIIKIGCHEISLTEADNVLGGVSAPSALTLVSVS